jgi:hypothetical protein
MEIDGCLRGTFDKHISPSPHVDDVGLVVVRSAQFVAQPPQSCAESVTGHSLRLIHAVHLASHLAERDGLIGPRHQAGQQAVLGGR